MVHGVKRLGKVDGYCRCSGGRFMLVETRGYCVGDWEQGRCGGMERPETVLGVVHS